MNFNKFIMQILLQYKLYHTRRSLHLSSAYSVYLLQYKSPSPARGFYYKRHTVPSYRATSQRDVTKITSVRRRRVLVRETEMTVEEKKLVPLEKVHSCSRVFLRCWSIEHERRKSKGRGARIAGVIVRCSSFFFFPFARAHHSYFFFFLFFFFSSLRSFFFRGGATAPRCIWNTSDYS